METGDSWLCSMCVSFSNRLPQACLDGGGRAGEDQGEECSLLRLRSDTHSFYLILLVDARHKANPGSRGRTQAFHLDKQLRKNGAKGVNAGRGEKLGPLLQPQHPKEPGCGRKWKKGQKDIWGLCSLIKAFNTHQVLQGSLFCPHINE